MTRPPWPVQSLDGADAIPLRLLLDGVKIKIEEKAIVIRRRARPKARLEDGTALIIPKKFSAISVK